MSFGDLKVQDLIYEDSSNNEITVVIADLATKNNPTFTGTVTVPTAPASDVSTKAASTAFVDAYYATKAGPAFTGNATGVNLTLSGNLVVNGTTTTVNTENLEVKDKNIIVGKVSNPSDTTADGGGISLLGASTKTFNWVNATDAWTSSEHIHLGDNKQLLLGVGVGGVPDLKIYHDSSAAINYLHAPDGTIQIKADVFQLVSDDTNGRAIYLDNANSRLELGFDGNHDAWFTGTGVEFIQDVKFDGATAGRDITFDRSANSLIFASEAKAQFGTGNDLQIYHDGTNSYVRDQGTGNLIITTNGDKIVLGTGAESFAQLYKDGAVDLYYDNTKRLETTSAGINVIGQINVNGSALSAAPEITGTTDGAVTAGDSIIVTSEGKLAKVGSYTKAAGTAATIFSSGYGGNVQIAYDKVSGKIAGMFRGSGKITAAVGTVSGTTVSWGTIQDVVSGPTDPFDLAFHNNVIVFGYRNSGQKVKAATVSGTVITFGSEVSISSGSAYDWNIFYSEAKARWVVQWHNTSNYPYYSQLVIGTVSGTTFSHGSVVNIFSDAPNELTRMRDMDSVGMIAAVAVRNATGHKMQVKIGEINTSNNSVTWQSQQEIDFGWSGQQFDQSGTEEQVAFAWHDVDKYAIVSGRRGSSDGNYVEYGYALKLNYNETTKAFTYNNSDIQLIDNYPRPISKYIENIYIPEAGSIVIVWVDQTVQDGRGWIRWKSFKSTPGSTTISFDDGTLAAEGNPLGADSNTYAQHWRYMKSVYLGLGRFAVGYNASSSNGPKTVIQQMAGSNIHGSEFIGFASSSVGDNASLTVKVTGNTLTTSNLTAGKKHYVQNNGSLSESADSPSVEAGIALSTTKLLIKG